MRRFSFLPSFYEACKDLPDDQRLAVYDAIIYFGITGEYPAVLPPVAKLVLDLLAPVIDKKARWLQTQAENGVKGGRPRKSTQEQNPNKTQSKPDENPNETRLPRSKEDGVRSKEIGEGSMEEKSRRSRFRPPSLDEVKAYCVERGNRVDPQRWMNYYQSNGWRVGKNPMKDWRAAVRSWERNSVGQEAKSRGPNGIALTANDDHTLDGIL